MNIPTTIVDNFFSNPDEIREYALGLDFDYPRGLYPGHRTNQIKQLNPNLFQQINDQILTLFFNPTTDAEFLNITVESQFQYTPEEFESGWIHQDIDLNNRNLAGVIYLTPNAPATAGTSIYRQIANFDMSSFKHRNEFYHTGTVKDKEQYQKARDEYNSCFEKILDVGYVYNRLLIYDTTQFHRESAFFGTDKNDSRLTIVFFMTIKTLGDTKFPINRMRDYANINIR